MKSITEKATEGAFYCDGCALIPISQLDLAEPISGWRAFIEGRGFEILSDDIGRPAIVRSLARALHRERAEAKARAVEEQQRRLEERRRLEAAQPRPRYPTAPAWAGIDSALAVMKSAELEEREWHPFGHGQTRKR